jgi:hypothetical protein
VRPSVSGVLVCVCNSARVLRMIVVEAAHPPNKQANRDVYGPGNTSQQAGVLIFTTSMAHFTYI